LIWETREETYVSLIDLVDQSVRRPRDSVQGPLTQAPRCDGAFFLILY
jgi:hypothetical protein